MPMTSTEMIRLLLKNGFIQVKGGKDSHKSFLIQLRANTPKFLTIEKN